MYTVIIQNQKTIEEFTEFHPLFLEALNKEEVGVCRWNESGTTIDTALPDLPYLTDDKEEWRAIIVCLEGDGRGTEQVDERNPFDFIRNKNANKSDGGEAQSYVKVEESPVPLIRLTQMLGGVPEPEIRFDPVEVKEENKSARIIFEPVYCDEDKYEYERLSRKYKFEGKLPKSIIIVTARKDFSRDKITDRTWKTFRESESSDFCRRNRYPSNCRFLTYDYKTLGANHLEYDKFCFWSAVLILSVNRIDPSTLQAYRLYSLDIVINKNDVEEVFSERIQKLELVSQALKRELRKQEEKSRNATPVIPEFEMTVDVPVKSINADSAAIRSNKFGLFSIGAMNEIDLWSQEKDTMIKELEKAIKVSERTLDIKADQTRSVCRCTKDDVVGLDKFQREDLTAKVDEYYDKIIKIQSELPEKLSNSEKVRQRSEAVKNNLRQRFSSKSAVITLLFIIAALIIGFGSVVLNKTTVKQPSIYYVAGSVLAGFIVSALLAFIVVLFQKKKLNGLIKAFNEFLRNSIIRLNTSTGNYSDYLSAVASHTRGSTYLVESEKIDYYNESDRARKISHLHAISAFATKIRIWAKAFNIKTVDPTDSYENVEFDTITRPAENSLYTFDYDEHYPVKLNDSGKTIESPFCFISRLKIEREEIYQDD